MSELLLPVETPYFDSAIEGSRCEGVGIFGVELECHHIVGVT